MIEKSRRKPYWRQTKLLAAVALVPPILLILGLPYWVGRLASVSLIGLPAGFLLAVHGVVVVIIAAAAYFVRQQEIIDRSHRAHEDY